MSSTTLKPQASIGDRKHLAGIPLDEFETDSIVSTDDNLVLLKIVNCTAPVEILCDLLN